MKMLRKKWYSISIWVKTVLLMGTMLAAMWVLVAMAMFHLHTFSGESTIIMNEYMDITGFMDVFFQENVYLELYIRPTQAQSAAEDYLASIQKTDNWLKALQPDLQTDQQWEYSLKRAIHNAMEYYRTSQKQLLTLQKQEEIIAQYLSLKTQSAYIDGYSRDLLHNCMVQGGVQWQEIVAANTRSTEWFAFFLIMDTVLLSLMLTVFTRSILKPLSDLGRAAHEISVGRYDAPPLIVQGEDELGRTAYAFNLMQSEIRRTIHKLEQQAEMEKLLLKNEVEAAQMQHRLQESRFAQLQSQINPHFLFNTLNTISALAREENAPLSEDLILRLSRFFRYSLKNDEQLVTLGREIQLLRDYMELQEVRYSDRITMEIHSDSVLEDIAVPKFILQPLVENSILHGLRTRKKGGRIRVRIFRGRRGVTIIVTDNGYGFDPHQPPSGGKRRSVGLANIRERVEMSGGQFKLFSRPGLGTSVRIAWKEGADDQNTGGGR